MNIYANLSIVIPAYNEQEGIGLTLQAILRDLPGAEIIVVDDCSRDATAEAVQAYKSVRLVRHSFNKGQGSSLKTGMGVATKPFVAWFDADNEHRTVDLIELYNTIIAKNLVAVIGQRVTASASILRGSGKWVIRVMGRGLKIKAGSDINCGLRIFRTSIIRRYLGLIPNRFSSSMMTTLIMLERAYPIEFYPIRTNPRIGHSTVRLKDGFEAILWLLRAVMLFAPIRIFLPAGVILILLSVIYSVVIIIIVDKGLPTASVLLAIAGLLSIMLGLIADQISQLRIDQLPAEEEMVETTDLIVDVAHGG